MSECVSQGAECPQLPHDGAVLVQACREKEMTCPKLASSGRCKVVVLAIETGGRWSEDVGTLKSARRSILCENRGGRECWPSPSVCLSQRPARCTSWCLAVLYECDPRWAVALWDF